MSVSVVGFDVGNLTSYIAVAKGGGIETIANEYSDRCTPTCIAFDDNVRLVGAAAKQKQVVNVKNTVVNFQRLLGKKFADPAAQVEMQSMPNVFKEIDNGRIGIEVLYMGEKEIFTPEQLMAMQLTKLAEITESNLGSKVVEVVINVPTYYTDTERRAVLDASRIAGLNCVRLVNDTTAIGIAYGLYNKDLPEPDQPPRVVAFVSIGQSSSQVSICSFNRGKMKVNATACDASLGGRDFDNRIFDFMCNEFAEKYKLKVKTSTKATIRLLQECEKLKKLMSANSTAIPLNIECFMEDKDVVGHLKRKDFEDMSADLFQRLENTLKKCLSSADMKPGDIKYVELIGGSTRIPAIKSLICSTFGQEGRTTLNADEAVARGCALQAAICSPSFKVREFNITDSCPYAIMLRWDQGQNKNEASGESATNTVEVLPRSYAIPCSRQFTFSRRSDFSLEACYTNPEELPNKNITIGVFKVTGVVPNGEDDCIVKVKVRMNANGIFTLSHAQIAEKHIQEEEMETDPVAESVSNDAPANGDVNENAPPSDTAASTAAATSPEPITTTQKPKKTKKVVTKHKDLTMIPDIMQFSQQQLMLYTEKESSMIAQDRLERDRANAKNSVEEYVYFMREKLAGPYEKFVKPADAELLLAQLSENEDWLYGEGENLGKKAYLDRLDAMKSVGDKIQARFREAEQRPHLFNKFRHSIVHIRKILDKAFNGDELYSHLSKEDLDLVQATLIEKENWFNKDAQPEEQRVPYDDPVVTCVQINAQREALDSICLPILNKPKPVVQPPPPPPAPTDSSGSNVDPGTANDKQGDGLDAGVVGSDTSHHKGQNGTTLNSDVANGKVDVNGDLHNTEPMETD